MSFNIFVHFSNPSLHEESHLPLLLLWKSFISLFCSCWLSKYLLNVLPQGKPGGHVNWQRGVFGKEKPSFQSLCYGGQPLRLCLIASVEVPAWHPPSWRAWQPHLSAFWYGWVRGRNRKSPLQHRNSAAHRGGWSQWSSNTWWICTLLRARRWAVICPIPPDKIGCRFQPLGFSFLPYKK